MLTYIRPIVKAAGLMQAGRESTKHPNVIGVYVPKDQVQKALIDKFGSQAGVNQAAADALKNIMRNGTTSTKDTKAYGIVTEFKLDNGIGARFNARTNEFIGFLGRGLGNNRGQTPIKQLGLIILKVIALLRYLPRNLINSATLLQHFRGYDERR